jgi:hypothetical protein
VTVPVDLEEFWNQVHPSRLIHRSDTPTEEVDDFIAPELLIKLISRLKVIPDQQQETFNNDEKGRTKAKICVVLSQLILGAKEGADVEDQAYDLMHLPTDYLLSTGERIIRLKGKR